ncbi:MAG: hypothetical protein K5857_01440 [Lachnospiraceae bacterium]|nr:hypothetical protein [Lachnospiraceae bacterium]
MEDYNTPYTTEMEALLKKRRMVRAGAVGFVIVCTLFLAVMSGTMIALWDTGKTSEDLFALMKGTYVEARVREEKDRIAEEEEARKKLEEEEALRAAAEEAEADENLEVVNEVETTGESLDVGDTSAALDAASDINVYVDPNVNYPLDYRQVDDSYFNDALFIGDSRLQGFGMYSGLPGTFYAATGFQLYKYDTMKVVTTDAGKVPILDALAYDTYTKIYIKVGLNEMGGNDNVFESKYVELIDKLRASEPRAIIYVHGLLPVTAAKSSSDSVHNNTNVEKRNDQLKKIAAEHGAYYLDVGSALAGPDGALPGEMAADGIHLKAQYMDLWKQYLLSHAVE